MSRKGRNSRRRSRHYLSFERIMELYTEFSTGTETVASIARRLSLSRQWCHHLLHAAPDNLWIPPALRAGIAARLAALRQGGAETSSPKWDAVKARFLAGAPIVTISRDLDLAPATVRRALREMEVYVQRSSAPPPPRGDGQKGSKKKRPLGAVVPLLG